jgi:hypothetical protein
MIDHSIDHAHRQAEAMERDALDVDARLSRLGLPGDWMLRSRSFTELRNPYATKFSNLTVRAILEARDRALAHWLAQREGTTINGVDYRAQERAQQQADSAARLQQRTEALRARNDAIRQRNEHERTHGRWVNGRLVR